MLKIRQRDVSLAIALSLAFVGGFLDIYTYIARGKVFANTQTGNLVLLGKFATEGNVRKVVYYLVSILAFTLGIVLAKVVEHVYVQNNEFLWYHVTIGIEIALVLVVMWLPSGQKYDVLANILISFVCAIQVQSFRKVNGIGYSTAMFTGNVKNASERFCEYFLSKDKKALQDGMVYLALIISFVIGAAVGTIFTKMYKTKAVGVTSVLLFLVFLLLFYEDAAGKAC